MVPTQNLSAPAEPDLAEFAVNDQSSLSLPVHLVLEITRGRTRFPRRPVTHSRFLIGAGATCDLRLGGDRMPALHSIITVAGREFALEAIGAEPGLTVNGRLVRNALLHDGDKIGIGEVELVARLEAGHAPAAVDQSAAATRGPIDVDRPLSDISAAELIDLIEREEDAIEEFESRQRDGAKALLNAVTARVDRNTTGDAAIESPREAGSRAPIPAPHFLSKRPQVLAVNLRQPMTATESPLQDDIEELGKQLSSISKAILGSSQRATEREALYAQAADQLLDTQHKLVSQLEAVVDQVQTLKENEAPIQKPRAIA
jgi:hypothetical protein